MNLNILAMAWNFSSIQELTLTLITESNLSAMLMLLVYGVVAAELRTRELNFSRE